MDADVVAVCGSARAESYTRDVLRRALRAAAAAGGETELLETGDLPAYDPDADEQPGVAAFADRLAAADAVALGSPVYHGSYSATLKNALDHVGSDEFEDTTVGLVAVAGGSTYSSTLDHMRIVVRSVHGWVLPHQVGVPHGWDTVEDGDVVDEGVADRLDTLGEKLVRYAHIEPDCATAGVEADD